MSVQKTEKQILVITRVKKLRVDRGISQQQLATLIGATNGNIGNIESLKYSNKYTLNQLNIIAHQFNVSVGTFFKSEDETELSVETFADRVCEYLEG